MRLLLDAHTFLWFVWDDLHLGVNARALIVDASNQKLISAVTYWEIAIKVSIGKLDLGEPYRLLIAQAMVEQIPMVSGDPAFDAYPIARLW